MRVLVADDDELLRFTLRAALEEGAGHEVYEARDGAAALAALDELDEVDLLVVDLDMPVVSGQELIRRVRGRTDLEALPVLVISGETEEVLAAAVKLGAQAYLRKPFLPAELLGLVALWSGAERADAPP